MKKKRYEINPEHRAQLKPWADKWIKNALNCEPMTDADREAMRSAVNGMYEAADLEKPKHIVFVQSPLVAAFAGCFAAAIWHISKNPKLLQSLIAGRDATSAATYDATRYATDAATDAATDKPTSLSKFMVSCLNGWSNMWNGGNQWSGWVAYLSFFRHVAQLNLPAYEKFQHYEQAAIHGGCRMMHKDFCIVSDRPEFLKMDSENRPHCEDGPYCRWRDGWSFYYWHGVKVPQLVIEHPDQITVPMIQAEVNTEVRRVMIQRYGQAKYLIDAGARLVAQDDWGAIYRIERPDDTPIVMVKMVNSTPEADGSYKDYFERVHPELRPYRKLPGKDVWLGDPQEMKPRNAIASRYGLYGHEYAPEYAT